MSSDTIMLIFDLIIFGYGLYGVLSAIRMKKTGIPSTILVSKEELPKIKNPQKFCQKMYQPTVVFGCMACVFGGIEVVNQYVIKRAFVDILGVVCFLIVCAWYVKEMRRAKEEHLPSM